MWIKALTLCQIRSFGAGPRGRGWRVEFRPGLNRVAGRNGAGKTTLIEALGYAVFGAEPETSGRQDGALALLRNGAREGWVEAECESALGLWRVRRGVGKKIEPYWTINGPDQQPLSTNVLETRARLAQALGWARPDTLHELFAKLLGTRQGRLLEPFELPPHEARRHFSPLFDLDSYTHAQHALQFPFDALRGRLNETEKRMARAKGAADVLSTAPDEVALLEKRLTEAGPELEKLRLELAGVRDALNRLERSGQAVPAAQARLEAAKQAVETAEAGVLAAREKALAAVKSAEELKSSAEGHAKYLEAEKIIAELEAGEALEARESKSSGKSEAAVQVASRAELEQAEYNLEKARVRAEEDARLLKALEQEADKREAEFKRDAALLEARRREHESALASLTLSEPEPPRAANEETVPGPATLSEELVALERWAAALNHAAEGALRAGEACKQACTALAGFDPGVARKALDERDANKQAYENVRMNLNQLEARRIARMEMTRELESARMCPLLSEKCRQFDPGKMVLSEVRLDEALENARKAAAAVQEALAGTEQAAVQAQKQVDGTRETRVRADIALTDLLRHAMLTGDANGRGAFNRLAESLAGSGQPPARLPESPVLPHPGIEPWAALEGASQAAENFATFARFVASAAKNWRRLLEGRRVAHDEKRRKFEREEDEWRLELRKLNSRQEELEAVRKRLAERQTGAAASQRAAEGARTEAAALKERLSRAATRQERRKAAQAVLSAQAADQTRYAQALAARANLEQVQEQLIQAEAALEKARAEAALRLQEREGLNAAYDGAAHAKVREDFPKLAGRVAALESGAARDRELLETARQRAQACQEARKELEDCQTQRIQLREREAWLEFARAALKNAGPRVAERLTRAVNARAQRLFNTLSPREPGLLSWQPDYELRLIVGSGRISKEEPEAVEPPTQEEDGGELELVSGTTAGVRRFASLSGGQKALAALAVQLALVQQFSRAGLCIFDEPTYGLDAEARARLAEAVLEARQSAGLEQLFVVSHDEAFDGRADHTVWLEYVPGLGSSPR